MELHIERVPPARIFEKTVQVAGESITVRGNVVDGVVKIGTAFIK